MFTSLKEIAKAIFDAPGRLLDRLTSKWVLIVGHSMHPALQDRERVRVSRRAYRKSAPQRWDIVFFEHPKRERFWETKRVVGLPGEMVQITGGRLLIDGVELEDEFIHGVQPRIDRTWALRDDQYVVLGDNRRRSTDSRDFGPVSRDNIVGKVVIETDDTD